MYPSGPWRGYWEQIGIGRQSMSDLILRFSSGQIDGQGIDVVGQFILRGTYDGNGAVMMVKTYLGKHDVLYQGAYDGEGTIHGRWSIGDYWSGSFALAPILDGVEPDYVVATVDIEVPA